MEYLGKEKGISESGCIRHFVGGLHFVDYLNVPGKEDNAEKEAASIKETAAIILEMYPNLKVFSGHCTCHNAGNVLKSILGSNYHTFTAGSAIECR